MMGRKWYIFCSLEQISMNSPQQCAKKQFITKAVHGTLKWLQTWCWVVWVSFVLVCRTVDNSCFSPGKKQYSSCSLHTEHTQVYQTPCCSATQLCSQIKPFTSSLKPLVSMHSATFSFTLKHALTCVKEHNKAVLFFPWIHCMGISWEVNNVTNHRSSMVNQ